MAKKAVVLKVGAVKAHKALKIAKLATVLKTLKKHPIIIPVPVPIKVPFPIKFPVKKGVPFGGALGGVLGGTAIGTALGAGTGFLGGTAVGSALGGLRQSPPPVIGIGSIGGGGAVQGIISGAQNIIKNAGSSFPGILPTLANGIASASSSSNAFAPAGGLFGAASNNNVVHANEEPAYQ